MSISETDSGWIISFAEGVIDAIEIDFRLSLKIADRQDLVQVIIESPLTLLVAGRDDRVLDPNRTQSLAPVLELFKCSVSSILVGRNGILDLEFLSDSSIRVMPSKSYESWQVGSLGDYMLICEPGGHVSLFSQKGNPS